MPSQEIECGLFTHNAIYIAMNIHEENFWRLDSSPQRGELLVNILRSHQPLIVCTEPWEKKTAKGLFAIDQKKRVFLNYLLRLYLQMYLQIEQL